MSDGELIRVNFQDRRLSGETPAGNDALSQAVAMIVETEQSLLAQGLKREGREYFTGMIQAQSASAAYNSLTSAQQDEAIEMAERILAEEREE